MIHGHTGTSKLLEMKHISLLHLFVSFTFALSHVIRVGEDDIDMTTVLQQGSQERCLDQRENGEWKG